MIRIRDIVLTPEQDESQLLYMAAAVLKIPASQIASLKIHKKSIDARKKPEIRILYTLDAALHSGERQVLRRCKRAEKAEEHYYRPPKAAVIPETRPIVVGFEACWNGGTPDPESNVQFGEGGAGTFSDGKLNTGTKNERISWVLRQLVKAGAPEEILYDARPHVGTDRLIGAVQNLRKRIERRGGEVRLRHRLTGIRVENGAVCSVSAEADGQTVSLPCTHLLLAPGHSARDTFELLNALGVEMAPKPFSMGVRIEHRQAQIDAAQYGRDRANLPAASYKLACHLPDGAGVYTFCMCPGGYVVAAASEPGGVVTNGMSLHARDGENANSALLVSVTPADFPDPSPLGGMYWQREIERRCFAAGGGNYRAPAQLAGDFLAGRASTETGTVQPTYRPGVTLCDLHDVLPVPVTRGLEQALPILGAQLEGFDCPDAVLTAPETRSSSPVRIVRGGDRQSSLRGLYPCGEGAGYAGGIVSAAVDGMLTAEALIEQLARS